jgi:hypothetical protein
MSAQRTSARRAISHNAPQVNEYEKLEAIVRVLAGRFAAFEQREAEVRSVLGLNAAPPALGDHWATIKQVAFLTGFTTSGVRGWMRTGKVKYTTVGGRVFIDTRTLPTKKRKNV